ncbi:MULTISPECIES: ATP-binding protein [unclassified Spirosoma]|uniref:sensor histidine kinase n=1 Tax=unclassified Spirosoma TaxID=2621999 RepID=UPI00096630D5|nr:MULTISPECIES: ATP-binding protein [unclassified Spirosoma]MBN8822563.1 two-component sensor histidine kinase [Spirosoma sp.]OJW74059.1 MAG: two-component sensor histidine kinase [Spirosoma sp. 48-14]
MEQVIDFFRRLTDSSDWPPRWFCGNWTDFHGWLYIGSDLMIWLAYMVIPLILVRYLFVKKGVPLPGVFWLFGAFILLCGLTHLLDAIIFWVPIYRISALVRFLTGLVSIATVLALFRYFNEAVGLRTSKEYERELSFRQQAVLELTRSNEELQQFAYVASHDLQSPLKTIFNYLNLLNNKYTPQLSEDARKLITISMSAAERMRTLIDDLLDFSRVGSNVVFTQVHLNQIVADILEEQQEEIQASGAKLDVGPLPILTAHPTDLKQVFQNLISNSLKYRKPGVSPQITIRAVDESDQFCFAIRDNGIGIEPQYFDRVFQIFQRLHGRHEYSGTGIGLATCKKVVHIYGGQIWIESEPNVGSTFFFTIPKNIKTTHHYAQTDSVHSTG